MARSRGALPAPTPPHTTALGCSWALRVHKRDGGFSATMGQSTWVAGAWFYHSSIPAELSIFTEDLSVYASTSEKGEMGGHIKRLGGSGGYRPCSASTEEQTHPSSGKKNGDCKGGRASHTSEKGMHMGEIWALANKTETTELPNADLARNQILSFWYLPSLDTKQ